MNIDEVLRKAEEEEVGLANSDWFEEPDHEQLRAAYAKFEREYDILLPQFVARLGQPDFTEVSAPELKDELYCEARRLAGWKRGEGYMRWLSVNTTRKPLFSSLSAFGRCNGGLLRVCHVDRNPLARTSVDWKVRSHLFLS